MSSIPATTTVATQDYAVSLLALLRDMVKERRISHRDADALIVMNLTKGLPRRGKAKLNLKPADLVIHSEAVETRRRTNRELKVLVPLMQRVLCCVQMRSKTTKDFDKALDPVRHKLAIWATAFDKQGKYEKPVATLLVSTFPDLLKRPNVELKPAPSDASKVDENRLKLYNKITSAGLLDGMEIERLRVIFWG